MFALVFLAVAFAQDTLVCEATDDSGLRYEEWSKSGGAAPGPDTVMFTAAWKLRGRVLHEASSTYGLGGMESTTGGRLDWLWALDKTRFLRADPSTREALTVYRAEVRLWARDGGTIHADLPDRERTVAMTCARVKVCCIP